MLIIWSWFSIALLLFFLPKVFLVLFSAVPGGVDSRNLYHNYIMVWVQDMQLNLLDYCKAEKVGFLCNICSQAKATYTQI